MKQRFSSLDIKVIAHELSKTLTSLRVVNIYDLSSRIFLFKFSKPDHREQLVVDSGFRCHLTSFGRTTANTPSPFVTRLRKFLRTRRVTSVSQIGTDRIIEFQFSDGQYRLYLEFYAGGNIVLCDGESKVIALLRNVEEGAEHEKLRIGVQYNLTARQNIDGIPALDAARVKAGLRKFIDRQADGTQTQNKRSKLKPGESLRKALASSISEYPPMLLDHALRVNGFDSSLQPEDIVNDDEIINKLVTALGEAAKVIQNLMSNDTATGYIIGKLKKTGDNHETTTDGEDTLNNEQLRSLVTYNDFHPFKPQQSVDDPTLKILEFEGFNRTVDEFFSSIEGQKLESRLQEREDTAKRKLDQARQDQAKRIDGLQQVQEVNVRKAQAIEANLERVAEATDAINGLIAQGMDWVEIDRLIELEQKRQNPVAEIIKIPLKLHENTATLLLAEWEDNYDEDEGYDTNSEPSESDNEETTDKENTRDIKPMERPDDKRLAVDIDLALSSWSNARQYYDQKKTAATKEEKTLQASSKALKSAQQKIETDLKKALKQEKHVLQPLRKQFWFEKYVYFISSDGYLVLGGRDNQQNEILYRRHLKRGDVYVHADLTGAIPMIIKNNPATPDAPIPPSTLSQTGNLCVSTSSAWDSKAVMSAWWVNADQISKTHESGEYLGVGGFAIRGNKNFLPPAQLLLGFAVLFRISEDSKAKHIKHRISDQNEPAIGKRSSDTSKEATAEDTGSIGQDDVSDTNLSRLSSADEDGENSENDSTEEMDEDRPETRNPLQSKHLPFRDSPHTYASDRTTKAAVNPVDETVVPVDTQVAADEIAGGVSDSDAEDSGDETVSQGSKTHEVQTGSVKPKNAPLPRGKRSKKKKIATKYANQDAEDREEAMRLLGSKAGQERAAADAAARKAQQEADDANKERRREQHLRNLQKAKASEEARLTSLDNEGDGDDDEAATSVDLAVFVGTPLAGDEILEALPVCAPWAALTRYKYKAKLQPGSQKKGKAVREILGKWGIDSANKKNVDERAEDVEKMWPREVELIKGWKETEVFNVLPVSKVRVMMSGASTGGGGGSKGGAKGSSRGGKGNKRGR